MTGLIGAGHALIESMRALIVSVVVLLGLAAQASAATVESTPGESVWFTGAPGVGDDLTIEVHQDTVVLRDAADEITVTGDCTALDAHAVSCSRRRHFVINLGDGDDRLLVETFGVVAPEYTPPGSPVDVTLQIDGGPGDDRLQGGGLNESIDGRAGADVVRGGPGRDNLGAGEDADADVLEGGPGWDELGLGGGPDVADGGEGADGARFSGDEAVSISLDGVPNDGVPGQGANLLDIERAHGGPGADTIVGSEGPDQLNGIWGDDVLIGLGGEDIIWGHDGADRIDSGDGPDRIDLFEWDVKLPDQVTCGAQRDFIEYVSADDVIDSSCENAFGDPWGTPRCGELSCLDPNARRGPPPPVARFGARGTFSTRARTAVLPVTCPGPGTCHGWLRLKHGRRLIAEQSLAISPSARRVRVLIPGSLWRRVPRRGDFKVRAFAFKTLTTIRLDRRR